MNLEELIKERNDLRTEIENRRKQNEDTLIYINEFFEKISKYVKLCNENKIYSKSWHNFDGDEYLFECSFDCFLMRKHDANKTSGIGETYIRYSSDSSVRAAYCSIGIPATLKSITKEDGSLNENAEWFKKNIETILSFLEDDLKNCIQEQIAEAKRLLGR